MDRRTFITLSKGKTSFADHKEKLFPFPNEIDYPSGVEIPFKIQERPPVLSGLDPYTGPWGIAQAAHLLRRVCFGAPFEEVEMLAGLSMNQAVNSVLQDFTGPLEVPVNDYNDDDVQDPVVPFGQPWIDAPWNNAIEGNRIASLKAWWLRRMLRQVPTIGEKMILFWHNHIPVEFYGVFVGKFNYRYIQNIYQNALGNFKTLIKALTLDHAMLHYLNNQYNSAQQPDENYARELQELFCIGKGPNAKFTEEDVQAMARVLTGWRYDYGTDETVFAFWAHDTNDKVLSSFYNNAIITGRSGPSGAQELDDLLDIIFDNEEVALFICRKLYRFFVYHEIDAATEQNVIEPLAQVFRNNNYEIKPVLDTLFKSEHFFDVLNQGAILKSGLDYMVGTMREFNNPLPNPSMLSDNYQLSAALVYFGALIQHNLGDPPNVSGWPAYYQIPQYDKHWISTNTLPFRLQYADLMLANGVPTDNFLTFFDILETTKKIPEASDPNKLIDNAIQWLYGISVSNAVKLVLKSILLSGQLTDYYWTNAWVQYLDNPTDPMKRETVYRRLQGFYYYLLHLEEHHLC
jgi:hypothetical protein